MNIQLHLKKLEKYFNLITNAEFYNNKHELVNYRYMIYEINTK